ncbi:EpsG family protein [Enterococcus sp.]|uniref:EpsG family protein n=1 Tax=Enterococcus sp. TaxID=35783 RepID=UPI003991C9BB
MRFHQKLYINNESRIWKLYIPLFFSLLIPSIVAGMRYNVGTDYQSYYWLFELTRNSSIFQILNTGTEPLFLIIVKISSYILNNQSIYFVIFFLTIYFVYISIRELVNINWGYSMMLWFLIAFSPTLNIMRQMLAASIVLYAIINLYENKLLKCFVFLILALLVHNIAAIGFIAFFLQNKK